MGVFLAVLVIEVAVVARSGKPYAAHLQYGLQLLVHCQRVVYGLVDADAPGFHLRVFAFHHQFSPDVYHIVAYPFPVQQACHTVYTEAFGNGTAVQHRARVALDNPSVFQLHLIVSDELAQAVDGSRIYLRCILEPESPGIHQRSNGNVECAVCFFRYLPGKAVHIVEQGVGLHIRIVIDVRNDRCLVERRKRTVYPLQLGFYLGFQVLFRLVGDFIHRAEHQPLVGLVRCLLAQYPYGSHDEQQQERDLPFQSVFFLHIVVISL